MNKWLTVSAVTLLSGGLMMSAGGCSPGNNTTGATAAGAAAGGLLGAAAFRGPDAWIGVVAGALVGGVSGYYVGQYMDRQDRANMERAVEHTPVGKEATWKNTDHDVTYVVRPVKEYDKGKAYCREYQTVVTIQGEEKKGYGTACRQPDGTWKIVN